MTATPSKRSTTAPSVVGLLLCLAWLLERALAETWLTDDALISFRYVDNFLGGEGLVFNPGERLEAFSSPLFMALLIVFASLGASPFVVAPALGIAATVAELMLIFVLLGRRREDATVPLAALVAGALFASDRIVWIWATGGLETALASLLVLASLSCSVFQLREDASPRLVTWASVIHLLLALTRPEGLAFYAIYLAALLWSRKGKVQVLRSLAIVGGGVLGCEALRLAYFGAWLPHTHAAKLAGVPVAEFGRGYLLAFARREGLIGVQLLSWIGAPLLAGVAWQRARRDEDDRGRDEQRELGRVALLAGAYLLLGAAIVFAEGGDYMTDFRFMRPLMAVLFVGVAALIGQSFASDSLPLRAAALLVAAGLLAAHLQRQREPAPVFADAPQPDTHKANTAVSEAEAARFRAALLSFAEPGDAILTDVTGRKGYGHTLRTVDATGLTTARIEGNFYLRPEWATQHYRDRLPGHARWPKVEYMLAEGFAMITPKLSSEGPEIAEVHEGSHRRYRRYPFLHVTMDVGEGQYLRFFTTLSADELAARATRRNLQLCWRGPKQAQAFCADTLVEDAHPDRPKPEQPPGIEAQRQAVADTPAAAVAQYFGAMRAADCAWLRASTAGVQAQRDAQLTCAQLEASLEHMAPIRLWAIEDERPGREADERLLRARFFIEGKDRVKTLSVEHIDGQWRVTRL